MQVKGKRVQGGDGFSLAELGSFPLAELVAGQGENLPPLLGFVGLQSRSLPWVLPPGWAGCGSQERVVFPRCAGLGVQRDLNTVPRLLRQQQGAIGKF